MDPLNEFHSSDADTEGSDGEKYEDMESIESLKVSFNTKMHTLENNIVLLEDEPKKDAPIGVLKRKRTQEAEVGKNSGVPIENHFEIFQQDFMLDPNK